MKNYLQIPQKSCTFAGFLLCNSIRSKKRGHIVTLKISRNKLTK